MRQEFLQALAACVDERALVTDAAELPAYLNDWLGKWSGRALAVVRPESVEALAATVALCAREGVPIVPQGGNTGMSGGATPDADGQAIVLSTSRLRRVRDVDPLNNTMTLDAGVLLADAQRLAAEAGRFFPLSLGAEGSCTVGGNLATNAGGTAVLRYGNMREQVLGIEVVLPDGRIWNGLRGLRKDNTGYDLRDLFIGSEGTLGVITGATFKLQAPQRAHAAAWVGAASLDAVVHLMSELRTACGERLTAFEMMSAASMQLVLAHVAGSASPLASAPAYHVLVELSDSAGTGLNELLERHLEAALGRGDVEDAIVAQNETQRQAFWRLREGISPAQVRAGKAVKHDVSLPISALARFSARSEAAIAEAGDDGRVINFGHIGDGNLHFNVLLPSTVSDDELYRRTAVLNRVVHDIAVRLGGSISAEHGVGQLRRDELRHYKSALEMELMERIKRALDPAGIMNPGKLL
ncbi:MAG: FAD-binding oxidoreductase [Burkholderiaceae bacterium]